MVTAISNSNIEDSPLEDPLNEAKDLSSLNIIEKNLMTLAHYSGDLTLLEIQEQHIRVQGIFRRALNFLLNCNQRSNSQLIELINSQVKIISKLTKNYFIINDEVTSLYIAVQKYNQCVSRNKKSHQRFILIQNDNVPEVKVLETKDGFPQKLNINSQDAPQQVQERRLLQISPNIRLFKKYNIYRYPGDNIDHAKEAYSIFWSTQKERLQSQFFKMIERIGRIFGINVTRYQNYHYRSNNETDEQIYAYDMPISTSKSPQTYWLGHASLFLSVPLYSSDKEKEVPMVNIITDPVERDLDRVFYPRQTRFAKPIEELPAPHIYLLSHNHLDHFDIQTIKKLVSQQPIIIVPKGDGYRYQQLGFKDVIELNWWEQQKIEFSYNQKTYSLDICAVPVRHWAGQGPCGGHESTFLGYVIRNADGKGGDLYFAGDTARLNETHVRHLMEYFNIKWSFQPGGPDEARKDMESTHQCSADGLWMHCKLMLEKERNSTKQEFLNSLKIKKTIYMHTMTFKLGNLHLSDTKDSIQRVISALNTDNTEQLKVHEKSVFDDICHILDNFSFKDGTGLNKRELASILEQQVIVPKIGSRIDLEKSIPNDN